MSVLAEALDAPNFFEKNKFLFQPTGTRPSREGLFYLLQPLPGLKDEVRSGRETFLKRFPLNVTKKNECLLYVSPFQITDTQ